MKIYTNFDLLHRIFKCSLLGACYYIAIGSIYYSLVRGLGGFIISVPVGTIIGILAGLLICQFDLTPKRASMVIAIACFCVSSFLNGFIMGLDFGNSSFFNETFLRYLFIPIILITPASYRIALFNEGRVDFFHDVLYSLFLISMVFLCSVIFS